MGAFSYNVAFELGERTKDVKYEFASAGSGFDILLKALKANPLRIEIINQFYELFEGSAQTI